MPRIIAWQTEHYWRLWWLVSWGLNILFILSIAAKVNLSSHFDSPNKNQQIVFYQKYYFGNISSSLHFSPKTLSWSGLCIIILILHMWLSPILCQGCQRAWNIWKNLEFHCVTWETWKIKGNFLKTWKIFFWLRIFLLMKIWK